jgi:DNA-binding NtrC family response regulator
VRDVYLNPGSVIYVGESRLRFDPLDESVSVDLSTRDRFGEMVGSSVTMRALFGKLERIAPTDASVLITGETGTGKELVAEAIHHHSARASGPFVVVDCGSIPDNLIASELFGHERGSFTGAVSTYAGAFERAHGGTIFLDEIGELPLELQPNLLGVLERRQVRRLGSSKPVPVDIRVVAATNRDLASEMNRGSFRSDLFYRLAVVQVRVPALRERPEDIPVLAQHFAELLGASSGISPHISRETLESLRHHPFPGNVRELRNVIERSMVLAEAGVAFEPVTVGGGAMPAAGGDPADLASPAAMAAAVADKGVDAIAYEVDDAIPYRVAKQRLVTEFDSRYLKKLLVRHGGNVSRAARAAGLDRMTVHKMLQRVGLGGWRGRPLDDED